MIGTQLMCIIIPRRVMSQTRRRTLNLPEKALHHQMHMRYTFACDVGGGKLMSEDFHILDADISVLEKKFDKLEAMIENQAEVLLQLIAQVFEWEEEE